MIIDMPYLSSLETAQSCCTDGDWAKLLCICLFSTYVLHVLQTGTTPGWLEALLKCGETLEAVQKGLEDYMETKTVAFPR